MVVIVDETTDVSKKSQLCVVFRYIDPKAEIQERFIGFVDVSDDRTANRISTVVFDHLEEFGCSNKLIAQTYDGASVNTGQYNGLAARVKSRCPQAMLTVCYAHKLNLVLQDSVKCIRSCKIFFSTVSGFASFFSVSSKRSHALNEIVKSRFPSVAPTRWLYNTRLVEMIDNHREKLIELFDHIVLNVTVFDPETRYCAVGFKKILQTLSLIF